MKIAGSVRPDSQTGQINVEFEDLPQAPFQEFDLHFFGSERGLLATPTQCGTYPVSTVFTSWASELSVQNSTQFFSLDSGPGGTPCPNGARPFSPSLQAGSDDNTAGAYTNFGVRLDREDGNQNLSGVNVKAPPGFLANLSGIPYCPEDAIALLADTNHSGRAELGSPACPPSSQVGTAVGGAGAGSSPIQSPEGCTWQAHTGGRH